MIRDPADDAARHVPKQDETRAPGQRWRCLDRDPDLLDRAERWLSRWRSSAGWRGEASFEALDLATGLDGIAFDGVGVTASALLDLASAAWLDRLAGNVRGRTLNGGLKVQLEGERWDGAGLEARTTNGGVKMTVPDRYSAQLETETVNGRVRVDFPVTVQGQVGKRLSVKLGAGGSTIRASTTNGGVSIRRTSTTI